MRSFRLPLLLLLTLWSGAGAIARAESTAVARYFAGLRQRGLLVLAEEYAIRQLGETHLSPAVRRQIACELTTTLVAHARLNPGPQQVELFASAAEYLQRELTQTDLPPADRFLLQGELALLGAVRGEVLTWELELQPGVDRAGCRELLSQSLADLQGFLERMPHAPEELSREEKNELEDRLRLALGQLYLDRARMASTAANRVGDLLSATRELEGCTHVRGRDELAREARLKLAAIARLQQNEPQAANLLTSLSGLNAPAEFLDRVKAEQIRLDLAASRYDQALDNVRRGASASPEVRALGVEVLASAAALAGRKQQLTLQDQLLEQARAELALVNGHWQRWASQQLQLAEVRQRYGPELASVVLAGQSAFQQGDLSRAAQEFAEATRIAHGLRRADDAVEFGLTRGSILLQENRLSEAADSFRQLVDAYPGHRRAAEADLLLCYARGMMFNAQPGAEQEAAYVAALENHRQRFAADPKVAEATWMLASLKEQQQDWQGALPLYAAIPSDSSRYDEAQLRVVSLDQRILNRLREQQQPTDAWEDQAILRLGHIVAEYPLAPESWSLMQAEIGLQGAKLLLQHRAQRLDDADALLGRIIESAAAIRQQATRTDSAVDPRWDELNRQARQLRILSLAGRGKLNEARILLQQLETDDPPTLLHLLNGLSELTESIPNANRRQLGELQRDMAVRLQHRRAELPADQQRMLDEIVAQAQVASGNLPEAAAIYEQLLQTTPGDRRLMTTVAGLYLQRGQPADLQHAREWWVKLEALEQPGSEPWLVARLEVIRIMVRQQDIAAARKLLGVTRILYPKAGSAELRQQYADVAKTFEASGE